MFRWKVIDKWKDEGDYFLSEIVQWKYFCLQEERRQPMAKSGEGKIWIYWAYYFFLN